MISELDCRILAKACGLCWHEWERVDVDFRREDDPTWWYECKKGCGASSGKFQHPKKQDFSTPDDWEMVRVKVVVPNGKYFSDFTWDRWICDWEDTDIEDFFSWWNTKTPEEQCQIAADFIKSRPDLFPWAVEMEGR